VYTCDAVPGSCRLDVESRGSPWGPLPRHRVRVEKFTSPHLTLQVGGGKIDAEPKECPELAAPHA